MTREEFMTKPSDFRFCLNPLDVDLTKMQYNLIERMKTEAPSGNVPFEPIVETFTSKNPEREYGDIVVIIYKDEQSFTGLYYIADIIVCEKQGDFVVNWHLYRGEWEDMVKFIDGKAYTGKRNWDFFSLCKANALWLDYQVRADKEQRRLKALEEELAKEDGKGLNILVSISSGRDEGQWPTQQLRKTLPEANIQAPKLPVFGRDASELVNNILREKSDINVVIMGDQTGCFQPDMSAFNVCRVRPTHPLSELGEYVCSEAIALDIYWRKDADELLRHRVENRLSVFAKRILDERIEQYHHEGGQYEEVADTAVNLYAMLLPKLPKTGGLEQKLTEELPVRVEGKDFQLVMTLSPGNEEYVSINIVMKHPSIRDHICMIEVEKIENLGKLIVGRDGQYKIYSSVQRLMAEWPTPLEEKLSGAKHIDTDEFCVESGEESKIVRLNKNCKIHIMGHTFHGIEEIMSWKGTEPMILEKSKMFPCFDSYDYASENRFYHNFLFCKNEEDANGKRPVYDAIPRGYGCVIDRRYPENLRPLVYYADESSEMLLFY